jgi:hypothetical protein
MPAPLTHIAAAVQYLNQQGDIGPGDKTKFISGTTWPDIRNLGVIDRAITHSPADIKLGDIADILRESPWEAGRQHHLWLDKCWSKFFGAEFLGPENSGIKFVNDRLLWRTIALVEWQSIGQAQRSLPIEEMAWHIPLSATVEWHAIITYMCSYEPTIEVVTAVMKRIHRDNSQHVDLILNATQLFQDDQEMLGRLKSFNSRYIFLHS